MSFEIWLAFAIASTILLIIPGPTILTVISYSVAYGSKANVPLIAAVALGDSAALALSLLGLGALLSVSAIWFTVIKWVGGLYLLYLGLGLLHSGFVQAGTNILANKLTGELTGDKTGKPKKPVSRWKLFANTWLVTALNPKGMVFFVAFLPQFVNSDAPVAPQLWMLSITFVLLATLNTIGYAVLAGTARRLLTSPRAQRRFNLSGGSLLSAAGVWALTARQ